MSFYFGQKYFKKILKNKSSISHSNLIKLINPELGWVELLFQLNFNINLNNVIHSSILKNFIIILATFSFGVDIHFCQVTFKLS
jgi:hypothetical protein